MALSPLGTHRQKSIGIVGLGYVGKAMYSFFKQHYPVRVYDTAERYQTGHPLSSCTKESINECDLGIVCVPTPQGPSQHCDVSIVEEVIDWLDTELILIKSTVEVGTTERLKKKTGKRIVFSPEYCGESSYWTPYKFHTDIKETPFFTFGGDPKDTSAIVDLFLPVTGPVKTYRQTSAGAAELAKYMENSFYATKIAFCYEFAEIANTLGIDFNEVRELWLLDPRINPMHTAVFERNDKPFSGKCLPKDLNAIISVSRHHGYSPELLMEVLKSNERICDMRRARREN